MWKSSDSSYLEQAGGDDEDCKERGEGTNCEASGAATRVGWSGDLVVAGASGGASALDGDAGVVVVGQGGIRRRSRIVGGNTARCRSKLESFSSANSEN